MNAIGQYVIYRGNPGEIKLEIFGPFGKLWAQPLQIYQNEKLHVTAISGTLVGAIQHIAQFLNCQLTHKVNR